MQKYAPPRIPTPTKNPSSSHLLSFYSTLMDCSSADTQQPLSQESRYISSIDMNEPFQRKIRTISSNAWPRDIFPNVELIYCANLLLLLLSFPKSLRKIIPQMWDFRIITSVYLTSNASTHHLNLLSGKFTGIGAVPYFMAFSYWIGNERWVFDIVGNAFTSMKETLTGTWSRWSSRDGQSIMSDPDMIKCDSPSSYSSMNLTFLSCKNE